MRYYNDEISRQMTKNFILENKTAIFLKLGISIKKKSQRFNRGKLLKTFLVCVI